MNICKNQYLIKISVLSVIAFVVSLIKVPLFFALPMYKLDLGESVVVFGALYLDPFSGILIAFIKSVVSVILKGSRTMLLSEITDFLFSASLAFTSSFYIKKAIKRPNNVFLGFLIGTIFRSILSCVLNYYVLIPVFSKMFFLQIDNIILKANRVFPVIKDFLGVILLIVAPFNIVKSVISCTVANTLYKKTKIINKKVIAEDNYI